MLEKLIKKHNSTVQKAISEALSEGLRHETANLKKLEGDKLQGFIDIFNLEFATPPEIYFNNYNILFCEQHIYDQVKSYLKSDSLVVRIEIPKLNINVWCHEMFQDPLFYHFFEDVTEDLGDKV